jgi:hypothetical protein
MDHPNEGLATKVSRSLPARGLLENFPIVCYASADGAAAFARSQRRTFAIDVKNPNEPKRPAILNDLGLRRCAEGALPVRWAA